MSIQELKQELRWTRIVFSFLFFGIILLDLWTSHDYYKFDKRSEQIEQDLSYTQSGYDWVIKNMPSKNDLMPAAFKEIPKWTRKR